MLLVARKKRKSCMTRNWTSVSRLHPEIRLLLMSCCSPTRFNLNSHHCIGATSRVVPGSPPHSIMGASHHEEPPVTNRPNPYKGESFLNGKIVRSNPDKIKYDSALFPPSQKLPIADHYTLTATRNTSGRLPVAGTRTRRTGKPIPQL